MSFETASIGLNSLNSLCDSHVIAPFRPSRTLLHVRQILTVQVTVARLGAYLRKLGSLGTFADEDGDLVSVLRQRFHMQISAGRRPTSPVVSGIQECKFRIIEFDNETTVISGPYVYSVAQ